MDNNELAAIQRRDALIAGGLAIVAMLIAAASLLLAVMG